MIIHKSSKSQIPVSNNLPRRGGGRAAWRGGAAESRVVVRWKVPVAVGFPPSVFGIYRAPSGPKSLFSQFQRECFPRPLKSFIGRSHLRVLFGSPFPPNTINLWLFYSFVRFKGFAKDTLITASTNKNCFVSKGMVLSSTAVAKPHPSTRQTLTFGYFL